MPSPILARADALMQRRRQHADNDDVPVLTDAVELTPPDSDDDIPLLLDVEPAEPLHTQPDTTGSDAASLPPEPAALFVAETPLAEPVETAVPCVDANSQPVAAATEDIVREIARRVEQRLATELPKIIEATVCDFLAEQAATGHEETDFKA